MAIVLSHVHFCAECDEPWTCVLWHCPDEDHDLLCSQCSGMTLSPREIIIADGFNGTGVRVGRSAQQLPAF